MRRLSSAARGALREGLTRAFSSVGAGAGAAMPRTAFYAAHVHPGQATSVTAGAWRSSLAPAAAGWLLRPRHSSSSSSSSSSAGTALERDAAQPTAVAEVPEAGDEGEDEWEEEGHSDYRQIGRVEGPYTIAPKDVFAVVEVGSHQFKVTVDDLIYVEKLGMLDVNDKARECVGCSASIEKRHRCCCAEFIFSRIFKRRNTAARAGGIE